MKTNQTITTKALLAVMIIIVGASCKSGKSMSSKKTQQANNTEVTYAAPPANEQENTVVKYSENGEIGKQLYIKMGDYAKMLNENLKDVAVVNQVGEGIVVTMKKGDYFNVDSYMLKKDGESDLLRVVHSLKLMPDTYVQVSGHTDNTGSAKHNDKLSLQRAQQVANFLHRFGVNEEMLFFEGYGESIPGFTNKTFTGRDRNRRVDFVIIPSNGLREEARNVN